MPTLGCQSVWHRSPAQARRSPGVQESRSPGVQESEHPREHSGQGTHDSLSRRQKEGNPTSLQTAWLLVCLRPCGLFCAKCNLVPLPGVQLPRHLLTQVGA